MVINYLRLYFATSGSGYETSLDHLEARPAPSEDDLVSSSGNAGQRTARWAQITHVVDNVELPSC
jgi:hypothetical protein